LFDGDQFLKDIDEIAEMNSKLGADLQKHGRKTNERE